MISMGFGGGSGIRTLGTLSRPSVFKTGAFDHSAKPPQCGLPNAAEVILQSGKFTYANGESCLSGFRSLVAQGSGALECGKCSL